MSYDLPLHQKIVVHIMVFFTTCPAERSTKLSISAPGTPSVLRTAKTGSWLSSEGMRLMASASVRPPFSRLDMNTSGHLRQLKFHGDENHPPDHECCIPIVRDDSGTPSQVRSRAVSRSRSRTSSWQGRGVLFHPGISASRQGEEIRVSHGFYNGGMMSTSSKGSRLTGVYSPRPAFTCVRSSVYASNPRRPIPLQRSHSNSGLSESFDRVFSQSWNGSGSVPKSARKWAKMAHLHEVKDKRKEDGSSPRLLENTNGSNGGELDNVFQNADQMADTVLQIQRVSSSHDEGADNDTDDWESASDVGLDSKEGTI